MTTDKLPPPAHQWRPAYQWRRAAWVTRDADGKRAQAFEALVPLWCARCGQPLLPGECFSRVLLTKARNERVPMCRRCVPFTKPAPPVTAPLLPTSAVPGAPTAAPPDLHRNVALSPREAPQEDSPVPGPRKPLTVMLG